MDFLDPKLQRRHTIQLLVGYVCVAVAILIATLILLQIVYGFGLGKNGTIVQHGLVYVSSTPANADIHISGLNLKNTTNTRLSLVSGAYTMQLARTGYRTWQRELTVVGSSVTHYDYPFLFPKSLSSAPLKSYDASPEFTTQSPDHRWLLIKPAGAEAIIDEYDLKNPKLAAVSLTLPAGLNATVTGENWQVVEWSTDNQHVLLSRMVDGKTDFVMLDRSDPSLSLDLNVDLSINPTKINLLNKKYDQYYIYDAAAQTLQTDNLSDKIETPFLEHILAYQPYGSNVMLYASSNSSGSDKVSIDLLQDNKTYALREVAAGTNYLLDITQYSGSWYAVLGASSENKVYIYKDPVAQLGSKLGVLVPTYVLKTANPNYVSFSNNAQFIMDENSSQFSAYDIENDIGYVYDTKAALDAPQVHASWMDGDRLEYVSGGKLLVFDYDHANPQTLMTASPMYLPAYDPAYKFVDALSTPGADGKLSLTATQLRTPADQ